MKTKRIVAGTLILFSMLWSLQSVAQQKTFSKKQVTKQIDLSDFTSIEVYGLAQVYLQKGLSPKADLEVSGMPMSKVSVVVENEILKISTPGNYNGESVKIYITYQEVNKLSVSDATEIYSKGPIETSKLEINSLDASKAVLEIDVVHVKIQMKDNANLILTGTTKEQSILSKSTSGTFDNSGLEVKK